MKLLSCLIAIDGGGTKTETLLLREDGHILCRHVTSGCNALDIGRQQAGEMLLNAIEQMLPRAPEQVESIFCGIAGNCHNYGAIAQYLRPRVKAPYLQVYDDTYNVISSVLGHGEGCGLVAGTGSSLLVRTREVCRHIGGWGYLIDTGGSGYVLGRDAIYRALRAVDGRSGATILTELLHRQLGEPVEQAMTQIYAGGRSFIASLAHVVFEGREAGDDAATAIFDQGAERLAELVSAAERYFPGEYSVVLGGGLFAAYPEYVEAVRRRCPGQARLLTTDMPVVYGAAVEALEATGKTPGREFHDHFLEDYR